ncbi:MAG: hypothetical protein ACD_40C00256G0003 [uncultured bacterium]|nr:MAG: hypothetical protein ACD_40C00256G0003 [uncultured bacterium]KKU26674.1 MAG: hypothetical protein UX38_C0004G0054 [Microgenomates group bacterium GW2011_GWC1_46_16]
MPTPIGVEWKSGFCLHCSLKDGACAAQGQFARERLFLDKTAEPGAETGSGATEWICNEVNNVEGQKECRDYKCRVAQN